MTEKVHFNGLLSRIVICFLLLIQLFPPLWVQDVTSLRHFLLALFNVSALGIVVSGVYRQNIKVCNPLKFRPAMVLGLLIVWMAVSIIWAMNKVESIAVINRWILVFFASCLTGVMLCNDKKLFRWLIYCTMVVTFVNVLTCIIGYYYFDLHISQRRNLMLNGGYGNKNIFAVCLLLKLPLLYYAIFRYKGFVRAASLFLTFTVCFCLIILSTRSTFIGLGMHLTVLLLYALTEKIRFKADTKYIALVGLTVVIVLAGFFAGNKFISYNYNKYASKDVENFYTVGARVKTIEEGNSKGRLVIWKNTSEIIKRNPWLGYGVGNHKLAIMQVEAAKKMNYIVSDHAHNDFLEMQSELGVVGEALYVVFYLSMFVCAIRIIVNKKTKKQYRIIALCSMLMLLSYMNDAMFNFPLERATPQIYLALSTALLMFAKFQTSSLLHSGLKFKHIKAFLPFVCVIAAATFYIETTHFLSSVVQRQRILCHNSHNKNRVPPSYWVNAAPWLPNIDESTKPIAINNAMMFALEGDYRQAVNIILADDSNPYYALKEYRLASYYSHLNMTDSAFYWADKCSEKKPLCYDPVRIKADTYARMGDTCMQTKLIEQYLLRETKDERAWIDLMNVYIKRKDYNKADSIYKQSLVENGEKQVILSKKHEIEALKEVENR
ncbi:MAG: O-antigen ligase family protein [Bacteroidales bacterium]|nr:O-antigen ligase family protein [Bacteroidales bacterium]